MSYSQQKKSLKSLDVLIAFGLCSSKSKWNSKSWHSRKCCLQKLLLSSYGPSNYSYQLLFLLLFCIWFLCGFGERYASNEIYDAVCPSVKCQKDLECTFTKATNYLQGKKKIKKTCIICLLPKLLYCLNWLRLGKGLVLIFGVRWQPFKELVS